MAAKDLITRARAQYALGGAQGTANLTLHADENTTLDALITVVSDAIEKWCRRRFYTRSLDELYSGDGQERLMLREYPVQAVTSVRYNPVSVLTINNTDTTTNQRATVEVTSTALRLVRVASGTTTTDTTVTWSGNTTLLAVKNAVNALGAGWTATVPAAYEKWPSADLYHAPDFGDGLRSQGGFNCRNIAANVYLHIDELTDFQWHTAGWLIRSRYPYALWDSPNVMAQFRGGVNFWRVQYTAGYTTIPEAVQEACAQWTVAMFWLTKRDPQLSSTLASATASNYSDLAGRGEPPGKVQALLRPYRSHRLSFTQG